MVIKFFAFPATIARMGLDVTNVAASLAMSAENSSAVAADSSSNNKQNPSTTSGVTSAAVQAAAQQVLQNRVAQAQQVTGVALPSFYNPAAVNPMKYAQQIQKRKLLWSNKVGFGYISCPSRLLIVWLLCELHRRKMNHRPHLQPSCGNQQPSRKTKTEKWQPSSNAWWASNTTHLKEVSHYNQIACVR